MEKSETADTKSPQKKHHNNSQNKKIPQEETVAVEIIRDIKFKSRKIMSIISNFDRIIKQACGSSDIGKTRHSGLKNMYQHSK